MANDCWIELAVSFVCYCSVNDTYSRKIGDNCVDFVIALRDMW